MKNKIISIVLIVLFLGLSVFSWLKPATEYSESERRKLAQFPKISVSSVFSGNFMKNFETYSTEQFPLRDYFRALKAYVNNNVFNMKDNNDVFVRNGHILKLEYPLNEESVSNAAKKFKYVYDKYLVENDTKVYFSVVPDKNYYVDIGDYLTIDYNKLISQMKTETEFMHYIDISTLLDSECYYYTDTHWRQEKLLPVARKLASEMGVELKAEYKENLLENDFYGVYYGQYALDFEADKIVYLTNDILENVRVYDYENQKQISVYDMEKAFGRDPYEMFLSGSLPLISIENENATTEKELVIFRDSFGSSLAPFFAEGYKEITVVDIRYIHPNMLEKYMEFTNQDVLFIYSTSLLNKSETIK